MACGHIWKCTRASYVSRSGKCSMCRDDQVRECLYNRVGYGHHGGYNFFGMFLMIMAMCALASCFFYGRDEPDHIIIQQGQPMGGPGMYQQGMPGQTVVVQGGGGCALPPPIQLSPCPPRGPPLAKSPVLICTAT